jgi:hypothetical protein
MKILKSFLYCCFYIYAGIFIFRTSFLLGDTRFFCLFDDSMISMRYAKNLAEGFGLVWNPGYERIEGFSNPLWVLLMSFFHLFPVDSSKICFLVQVSSLIFYGLSLWFITKLSDLLSEGSSPVSVSTLFLTAFYFPLHNWILQGTEVGLQTFLICFSLWLSLRPLKTKLVSFWPYFLLGLGTLVRLDMVLPYFCISLFMIFYDKENRRKHALAGGLILFLFLGGQTLFRLMYFGELLPNTYYLKMTGWDWRYRVARGAWIFFQFTRQINPLLFIIPGGLLFFKKDRRVLLMLVLFSVQVFYSIWVGGDALERGDANRFLAFVMPLYFILYSYSLFIFLSRLGEKFPVFKRKQHFFYGTIIVFSLLQFNAFSLDGWREFLFLKQPYEVKENQFNVEKALLVKAITKTEAKIGASRAGAVSYFSDRYTVDFLGKSDKKIARLPAKNPPLGVNPYFCFFPGHNKWDYAWSIGTLQPDVVVHLWLYWSGLPDAKPYLTRDYTLIRWPNCRFDLYLKKSSPLILWDSEIIKSAKRAE